MWEQPTQARFKAAKFLATRCANKKYDLRNNQQSAINDYIQKTAPQHYPTVTGTPRQTEDIVSRLTTYQASIENKT
ncbi:hypothetical protein PF006_g19834 [Phytophthora fragariae]|uniref:Uncharacterized protein n=1 Tax=Phytophthora fragariae TaxID=53985 RepID=A0A6A3SBG4_9STRA|nr:hypothetical protein PF006_g19834 [Phytophthora fragariae]